MAWYDRFFRTEDTDEKLNTSQHIMGGSSETTREPTTSYERQYEELEIVNRAVNMIVDDAAEIPSVISGSAKLPGIVKGIKRAKVDTLLNYEPNLFQDINTFKRNLITDFILDGNIFVYFDGVHLYHLPSSKMAIHASRDTFVEKYTFSQEIDYSPKEIIHIKENSFNSFYRGVPRLKPAYKRMQLLGSMRKFQENFFKNGAVPGLVIKSPNTLSEKIKERMLAAWRSRYNPEAGGHRPLILDGGLEVTSLNEVNFRELNFQESIKENEKIILEALGVPPILMDSGNNANIRPNHRLYYLETILPIVRKFNFAFERYFGFDLQEDISNIPALRPELQDEAAYYSSLVNGGVMSPNEAREALRLDPMDGHDELRIPANIAGSASNPSEGGRPEENTDE